jgi:DNA-binding NtrC family response regulator
VRRTTDPESGLHYFPSISDATLSTLSQSDARHDRSVIVADELILLVDCDRPMTGSARYRLDGVDEVLVGRGERRHTERSGQRLTVKLPDKRVSSIHASICRSGAASVLQDLDSKNGVTVNGVRITRHVLRDGDIFECGRTFFRYRVAHARELSGGLDADHAGDASSGGGLSTFCEPLAKQLRTIGEIARTNLPVLILGASGTGKELIARAIHGYSGRRGAFVGVNCGALPENLVEAELFGARRGAFTGATEDRPGLIRASHEGTLFLDEIGELAARGQPTMLRALQEREVLPVGATRPLSVDLRLITATHRDLDALVQQQSFRADLLARISGTIIEMPTLNERLDDFGILLGALLARHVAASQAGPTIEVAAMRSMLRYSWPLNIRELEHAVRAALALSPERIGVEHLPAAVRAGNATTTPAPREEPLRVWSPEQQARRNELEALLVAHQGNISEVARRMDKDRVQIRRWIRMFGIRIEELIR